MVIFLQVRFFWNSISRVSPVSVRGLGLTATLLSKKVNPILFRLPTVRDGAYKWTTTSPVEYRQMVHRSIQLTTFVRRAYARKGLIVGAVKWYKNSNFSELYVYVYPYIKRRHIRVWAKKIMWRYVWWRRLLRLLVKYRLRSLVPVVRTRVSRIVVGPVYFRHFILEVLLQSACLFSEFFVRDFISTTLTGFPSFRMYVYAISEFIEWQRSLRLVYYNNYYMRFGSIGFRNVVGLEAPFLIPAKKSTADFVVMKKEAAVSVLFTYLERLNLLFKNKVSQADASLTQVRRIYEQFMWNGMGTGQTVVQVTNKTLSLYSQLRLMAYWRDLHRAKHTGAQYSRSFYMLKQAKIGWGGAYNASLRAYTKFNKFATQELLRDSAYPLYSDLYKYDWRRGYKAPIYALIKGMDKHTQLDRQFGVLKKYYIYLYEYEVLRREYPIVYKGRAMYIRQLLPLGILVAISGRVAKKNMAETKIRGVGRILRNSVNSFVDYYYKPIYLFSGMYGLRIWICYRRSFLFR